MTTLLAWLSGPSARRQTQFRMILLELERGA